MGGHVCTVKLLNPLADFYLFLPRSVRTLKLGPLVLITSLAPTALLRELL